MKHIAAYLLAVLGGQANPSPADIKKILNSVGARIDDERIATLCAELAGKNIDGLIEEGKMKMSSIVVASAAAAPAASTSAAPAVEEKKEEPKQEEKEEEEEEGDFGFGLFD